MTSAPYHYGRAHGGFRWHALVPSPDLTVAALCGYVPAREWVDVRLRDSFGANFQPCRRCWYEVERSRGS